MINSIINMYTYVQKSIKKFLKSNFMKKLKSFLKSPELKIIIELVKLIAYLANFFL